MKVVEVIYDDSQLNNPRIIERTLFECDNPDTYSVKNGYIECLNYKNKQNYVAGTTISHIIILPKDRLFYVKF